MIEGEDFLAHYGILRKSGRYPWGSGENPNQRNRDFLSYVEDLKKQGLSESEIAQGLGTTTTALRAAKSIAKNEVRAADISRAQRMKDKGMSNVAIGNVMGINESSVRALLDPSLKDRNDVLQSTVEALRSKVDENNYLDIGTGTERYIGISREKLNTAVAVLEEQGYAVRYNKVQQLGTGKYTTVKVLVPEGVTGREVYLNQDKIKLYEGQTDDGGRSYLGLKPPKVVDPSRVRVRYDEEGGRDADGVIYVRPGVDDLTLGSARYAQVRIKVGDGHYLKGMAMYKDDLPDGVDLMFNTNKSPTGNKLDAMKKLKDDPDNPFGSVVRQIYDDKGNVRSAMNLVNEEGDWGNWSKSISSQVLSKQSPRLIRDQLDLALTSKKAQYDEIMALTNPSVKKKLLQGLADDLDSSAVHMKAASLPRQRTQVILPFNSVKETEVYAPNFKDGERVVLVRYPHGGIFEIPEVTVNNRNPEARKAIGTSGKIDAIGINPKTATQLSGADFDGDTVLVIPNNQGRIKTAAPLAGLKGFDPQAAYPAYEGMPKMSGKTKQTKMGEVSNLITDMTIKGAPFSEIERAVRHSMVVIDAEKHNLNWKQSAKDNGISQLKKKYQDDGSGRSGAATIVSRASSSQRVAQRVDRRAGEGGPIDPVTGRKVYTETGGSYINKAGKKVLSTTESTRMAETTDARTLSSGTVQENLYASYANNLKAMANQARKASLAVRPTPQSKSAKAAYRSEVGTLEAKLNVALKNAPLERKAQLLANGTVAQKRMSNPDMDRAEEKKLKGQALTEARMRVGAGKVRIDITQGEWDAIQAGAVSKSKLEQILDNSDPEIIKKYATPRTTQGVSAPNLARARAMATSGYTQAEIAEALGVSTSTLSTALSGKD